MSTLENCGSCVGRRADGTTRLTWHGGVGKEEIGLDGDLMSGIGVRLQGVVGRTRIRLYAIIEFGTPAGLAPSSHRPELKGQPGRSAAYGRSRLGSYLDEEELGLPHQAFAHVPPEERGDGLDGHGAVRAVDHALLAVTQQDAGETRAVAVVFL